VVAPEFRDLPDLELEQACQASAQTVAVAAGGNLLRNTFHLYWSKVQGPKSKVIVNITVLMEIDNIFF
jgi:hypothetical protein